MGGLVDGWADGWVDILRFFSPELGRRNHTGWMLTTLGAHRLCLDPPPQCLTLIADDPCPALWAVTASQARKAGPSILAVIAGQAAVMAEGVVQADCGKMGRRMSELDPLASGPWAKEERTRGSLVSKLQGEIREPHPRSWGPI